MRRAELIPFPNVECPLSRSSAADVGPRQGSRQGARTSRVRLRLLVDEERGASHVPVLTALFGAAALLPLIGCANVTILLLARGGHRVHEIAVRHAVGATRSRIVGLLLCEALLVTLAATVAAVAPQQGSQAPFRKMAT